jgi:hypothetical protein
MSSSRNAFNSPSYHPLPSPTSPSIEVSNYTPNYIDSSDSSSTPHPDGKEMSNNTSTLRTPWETDFDRNQRKRVEGYNAIIENYNEAIKTATLLLLKDQCQHCGETDTRCAKQPNLYTCHKNPTLLYLKKHQQPKKEPCPSCNSSVCISLYTRDNICGFKATAIVALALTGGKSSNIKPARPKGVVKRPKNFGKVRKV